MVFQYGLRVLMFSSKQPKGTSFWKGWNSCTMMSSIPLLQVGTLADNVTGTVRTSGFQSSETEIIGVTKMRQLVNKSIEHANNNLLIPRIRVTKYLHSKGAIMSNVQFKNENPNFAASDKWRLTIGDLVLLTRNIHDFSIPGVYSEGIDGPSPGDVLVSIPSERLTYDPVVFTFVIDEDWKSWLQIHQWITSNVGKDLPVSKDITIELLDNLNRPIGLTLVLEEARPTALDNVLVDVDAAVPQLVTTVTFKFQQLVPLSGGKAIDSNPQNMV